MVVLVVVGDKDMNLFVVGKLVGAGRWEFAGVFDTEIQALENCPTAAYFIGPCVLNDEPPRETKRWPGAYQPLANVQAT